MTCHDVGTYLKAHWLPILSRSIAIYFIWAFHLQVGFPPCRPLTPTAATYLGLFAFFFLLPFAHRLKLGKLIEFEAKVERVQEEVKAVRTETRELVLTVSNMVNAVSNTVSQNVVVNPLPDQEEKQIAREDLSITLPPDPDPSGHYSDISEYVEVPANRTYTMLSCPIPRNAVATGTREGIGFLARPPDRGPAPDTRLGSF